MRKGPGSVYDYVYRAVITNTANNGNHVLFQYYYSIGSDLMDIIGRRSYAQIYVDR